MGRWVLVIEPQVGKSWAGVLRTAQVAGDAAPNVPLSCGPRRHRKRSIDHSTDSNGAGENVSTASLAIICTTPQTD